MVANLNEGKTKRAYIVAQGLCSSCRFYCPVMAYVRKGAIEWQSLPCGNTSARLVVKEDETTECDSYERAIAEEGAEK